MKTVLAVSLFSLIMIFSKPSGAQEPPSMYEEVLDTSHNILPRSEIPPSPHQVCLICHTDDEVKAYLEPGTETAPELAAIFEPRPSRELARSKALWASAGSKVDFMAGRTEIVKNNPSSNCLSCHDGVIGSDIHGMRQESGKFLDHPSNVTYPRESNGHFVSSLPLPTELRYWSIPDQNGKEIRTPTGPTSEYFSSQTPPFMAVRTSSGKVQCGSCHNPHSSRISAYLRESPKTLCLVCHIR